MDSTLIPKIQAPKIEPLNIDVPPSFPNAPSIDLPITQKEDPIKRAERSVLNSPKIDFGKIENQYQNKYVQVTPDKLEGVNEGEDITERINFDENFQAVKRQTQGEWERAGNTAKKFGAAATSTFLGGLATIPNIFGSAINGIGYLAGRDKPISEFFNLGWDSGINKTLADFNDEVNKNSINYKSNWSKDNWIEDMIPFLGDGGFQDIIASSGYTAGAIAEFALSGGIASVLSKGTKLAGLGERISKYLNSPEKLDKVINTFKAINKEDDVRKIIGEAGYLIGKGIEKSPQLYRAYVGAHVEAAFEGIEGAKRFEEEAIKMYKEKNFGMSPDEKTLQNIKAISQEVGDMRYKLNLAVLTVPNYLQMGALLKTFPGAEKVSKMLVGNNLIGEVQSDAGKFVVKKTKDVKLDWNPSGKAAKYLKKGLEKGIQYGQEYGKIPLSFSEGGEEYMQYIIDEYTSSLYKGVYLNPEKSKDVGEYLSQMFSTLSEKGTSKEAAQSFLMGSVGGGIQQSFNTGVEIATNSNRLKNKIATNEIIAERLEELSKSIFSSEDLANKMLDEDREYLKEILSKSLNQNSLSGTLEDRYTNALSGLNNLSVMEDVLKSGSIDAQRWYYNLKDRHLSQILHNVVSSGKQDVFREHLQELANSEPSAINELYGIKIEEQTRNHKEFVNDVLEKLNRIENNSKIINFSFNDIFEDLDKSNKYEQYKSELSHLKYTIDRQKERMNGLKSPTTDKISRFLTGDFSDIENRINTLSLVQKDTQDYSEAMKELARMKDALSSVKKAFIYSNEEGEIEKINFSKLADVLNKLDNTNDNTELSVFEDFRKVSDMVMIEAGLSDKSALMKRYKQLYSDKGFDIYLKEREDEIKKSQKPIEEASSKEEIKNKVEKELETVPQEIKEDVEKEVEKKVEEISKLPENEQKEAVEKLSEVVNEIVEKQLPNIKKEEEIIKELEKGKKVFDFSEEEQKLIKDKKLVDVVNNDVLDNVANVIKQSSTIIKNTADDLNNKIDKHFINFLIQLAKKASTEKRKDALPFEQERLENKVKSLKNNINNKNWQKVERELTEIFGIVNQSLGFTNKEDNLENEETVMLLGKMIFNNVSDYDLVKEVIAYKEFVIKRNDTKFGFPKKKVSGIGEVITNNSGEVSFILTEAKKRGLLTEDYYNNDLELKALKGTTKADIERRRQEDQNDSITKVFRPDNKGNNFVDSGSLKEDMQFQGRNIDSFDYKNIEGTGIFVDLVFGQSYVVPRNSFKGKTPRVVKVPVNKSTGRFDLTNNRLINEPNLKETAQDNDLNYNELYNEVLNAVTKYDAELAALEKENDFIIIPKEEQEEIKKENTTFIDDKEELQFDETNFFLNEEAPKKAQLTEKEKLQAENMMLETGKLPEKTKNEFLFQIGGYEVFNNEKSILGINGKRLTQKEIDEFNKLLNSKGWNINKKLTNGKVDLTNGKYLVEVDSYVPPQTPVDSQPSITSNDNLSVLQNDFYLNDTGIGKLDKKKGNKMLLKRREFLNSIDNINNIQWELKHESRDLKGKKLNFQYLFNKKLIKINEAPFFTIQAKDKEGDIIIQEFRDIRNGMLISKQFLSGLGVQVLDSFNISSKNILNADNINSLNDYVSFYSVIEYLKQTDENKLDELVEKLEIKPSYFSELIRNQELYELALKNKNNIKLERVLTNYASSTNLQNASLHANYNDDVKIEHLPNSMVIDENGNQYTAILDVNIPYESVVKEGETVKEKLKDKLELNIRNGVFYGTIPFDLQQRIKDELISQLNEKTFAPVDFLSNGFNLIFTGTDKTRPYVKPILSKTESIPSTTDIIEGIREGKLVGDVRTNGWFINLSGIQEQLSTKFEVAKVEYNKHTLKNDGDMDGITILFVYKDEQRNNVYFRKNYSLVTNTSLNTINFLTPRIKADLKKEFKDLDIDKISVNFVNSNPRKPTTYEGIVANNPYVIKGIEFINTDKETKSVKWDMRNNTAYSFQHDRIVPVLNKKTNKTKVKKTDEFASTPKSKKKVVKKEKEIVKEQKVVVVDVSNESDLIKFLNQFKEIVLQESKEGDITTINLNSKNYNIVENILEKNTVSKSIIKEIIEDDSIDNYQKLEEIKAELQLNFKELHTLTC